MAGKKIRIKVPMTEMINAEAQWVSLVDKPASRLPFRITKDEDGVCVEVEKLDRVINLKGVTTASNAITIGQINTSDPWSFSEADGNKLLGAGEDKFTKFASVHIGVSKDAGNKQRFSFPVAKLVGTRIVVFRSGVMAARARAAQTGDAKISEAARRLLDIMDKKTQKQDDTGESTMKLNLNLKDMFRAKKQSDEVGIAAIIIRKGDMEALLPQFKESGYEVSDLLETEDGHVVVKQAEFDGENVTAFKVNEHIGVLVTGVTKQFNPFLDSMSFAETMATAGFLPSLRNATEAVQDTVITVLRSSDDKDTARKSIATVMKDFSAFVGAMTESLPEVAFKMDELGQLSVTKAKKQAPAGGCGAGKVWDAGLGACVAKDEKTAKAEGEDGPTETVEGDEATEEDNTEITAKADEDGKTSEDASDETEEDNTEVTAKLDEETEEGEVEYDWEDPSYLVAKADVEQLEKLGVRPEGVSILNPMPPVKKKEAAASEEEGDREATAKADAEDEAGDGEEQEDQDKAAVTSNEDAPADEALARILKAVENLTDKVDGVSKEQKALGSRVTELDTRTQKQDESLNGTVLSGGEHRGDNIGRYSRQKATKSDDDVWAGSALDSVVN